MLNTSDFVMNIISSERFGNGAVFTCTGFIFALTWGKRSIYVLLTLVYKD